MRPGPCPSSATPQVNLDTKPQQAGGKSLSLGMTQEPLKHLSYELKNIPSSRIWAPMWCRKNIPKPATLNTKPYSFIDGFMGLGNQPPTKKRNTGTAGHPSLACVSTGHPGLLFFWGERCANLGTFTLLLQ